MFGVGQERKIQLILADKFAVGFFIVSTNAKHGHLEFVEGRQIVAKATGFLGATRCVVLRVKVQNETLPLQAG